MKFRHNVLSDVTVLYSTAYEPMCSNIESKQEYSALVAHASPILEKVQFIECQHLLTQMHSFLRRYSWNIVYRDFYCQISLYLLWTRRWTGQLILGSVLTWHSSKIIITREISLIIICILLLKNKNKNKINKKLYASLIKTKLWEENTM